MCIGNEGGVEICVHGLNEIFDDEKTEGIIQVDADNAFNYNKQESTSTQHKLFMSRDNNIYNKLLCNPSKIIRYARS